MKENYNIVSQEMIMTVVSILVFSQNSPSQDYTHPDDRTLLNYDMTARFKPFTGKMNVFKNRVVQKRPQWNLIVQETIQQMI